MMETTLGQTRCRVSGPQKGEWNDEMTQLVVCKIGPWMGGVVWAVTVARPGELEARVVGGFLT